MPVGFTDIDGSMLGRGFTRYWDQAASVPYLYNPTKHIFVSYEDEQSIAAKCHYVLGHGLGGVMFWDYASDTTGKLLKAIDATLDKKPESDAKPRLSHAQ